MSQGIREFEDDIKVGSRVRHTYWRHQHGTVIWAGSVTCEVRWDSGHEENMYEAQLETLKEAAEGGY